MAACVLGVGGTLNCDIPPVGLVMRGSANCSTCFALSRGDIPGQRDSGALNCEVLSPPLAGSTPCQGVNGPLNCEALSAGGILDQGSGGSSNCGSPPSGTIFGALNCLNCMGINTSFSRYPCSE